MATLGSILVAGAQSVLAAEALDPNDPVFHVGFLVGVAFVLIVRVALLALYVAALVVFARKVR